MHGNFIFRPNHRDQNHQSCYDHLTFQTWIFLVSHKRRTLTKKSPVTSYIDLTTKRCFTVILNNLTGTPKLINYECYKKLASIVAQSIYLIPVAVHLSRTHGVVKSTVLKIKKSTCIYSTSQRKVEQCPLTKSLKLKLIKDVRHSSISVTFRTENNEGLVNEIKLGPIDFDCSRSMASSLRCKWNMSYFTCTILKNRAMYACAII